MTGWIRVFVGALAWSWLVVSPAAAAIFDVTAFGADPAFAGVDSAGAQAAVDAACAAGGGEVHFPAGFYRLGRDTQPGTGFYSGLQVFCDNIVVSGVGDASVLMPHNSQGQTVITVCAEYSGGFGDQRCVFTNSVQNVTIRDLKIWDDDPLGHWGSEESHGVVVKNGHNVVLERLTLERLGDESVTFSGGSTGGVVQDSSFKKCPSLNSSGSCIEFDWGSNYTAVRNNFVGGSWYGAMITVNNNSAHEISDVLIENNHLVESSTSPLDRVWAGIWIAPNNAPIRDVRILNNTILNDNFNRHSIRITSANFLIENLVVQGNTLEGVVDLRAESLVGLLFDNNSLTSSNAGSHAPGLTFSGDDLQITHNTLSGMRASCIEIGGINGQSSNVLIWNNTCASNSDFFADAMIREAEVTCDPVGSLSSGLLIQNNHLVAGGAVTNGIELASCSQGTVRNNVIVMDGSGANYGIRGGGLIEGNTVQGANVSVRTLTAASRVTGNTLSGNAGVRVDTTVGAQIFGNDLGATQIPIEEVNGADLTTCWNNVGAADGCSRLLECHDGIDNDGDGQIDALDSACTPTHPHTETRSSSSCGLGAELVPVLIGLASWRRRFRDAANLG